MLANQQILFLQQTLHCVTFKTAEPRKEFIQTFIHIVYLLLLGLGLGLGLPSPRRPVPLCLYPVASLLLRYVTMVATTLRADSRASAGRLASPSFACIFSARLSFLRASKMSRLTILTRHQGTFQQALALLVFGVPDLTPSLPVIPLQSLSGPLYALPLSCRSIPFPPSCFSA